MNLLTCQSCQQEFFFVSLYCDFSGLNEFILNFLPCVLHSVESCLLRAPARLFFSCQAPRMCEASTFDLLGHCKTRRKVLWLVWQPAGCVQTTPIASFHSLVALHVFCFFAFWVLFFALLSAFLCLGVQT